MVSEAPTTLSLCVLARESDSSYPAAINSASRGKLTLISVCSLYDVGERPTCCPIEGHYCLLLYHHLLIQQMLQSKVNNTVNVFRIHVTKELGRQGLGILRVFNPEIPRKIEHCV